MKFTELGLAEPILRAIAAEGYEAPTPIQAQSIPAALAGQDVLGCAQTGTGKTGAFSLPLLHRLAAATKESAAAKQTSKQRAPADRRPRALVLCPTRELASQIEDSLTRYGRHLSLGHLVIFGGVNQAGQVRKLRSGVDIVVATPGRLLDLMNQGFVDLSAVRTLVLDEADRMLDMGFINDIRKITQRVPAERQTLLFSATIPRGIERLAASLLKDPVRIDATPTASAADTITQSVYHIPKPEKAGLLGRLITAQSMCRTLVFTRTKHGADKLVRTLRQTGVEADAIHGNKSQGARTRALRGFKSGRTSVLVATDVASRGIDVDDITHVINYDLPAEAETYVHRIGRTARAGKSGIAISFCDDTERSQLRAIERLINKRLDRANDGERGGKGPRSEAKKAPSPGPTNGAGGKRRRRPARRKTEVAGG